MIWAAKVEIFSISLCFFVALHLTAALRHCEEVRRSNPGYHFFWIASFLAMTQSVCVGEALKQTTPHAMAEESFVSIDYDKTKLSLILNHNLLRHYLTTNDMDEVHS